MDQSFFGKGIYPLCFASRLSGIPSRSIRRWLLGYEIRTEDRVATYDPIVDDDFGIVDGTVTLSFLDLIEVQFLEAFRRYGVKWATIRKCTENAKKMFGFAHPFSTRQFYTDGRSIIVVTAEQDDDERLMDLVNSQLEMGEFVRPILKGELGFSDYDQADRWWPMGRENRILIDPRFSFGRPVVSDSFVPTDVLTACFQGSQSIEIVAEWYETDPESVRQAIEYEMILAA